MSIERGPADSPAGTDEAGATSLTRDGSPDDRIGTLLDSVSDAFLLLDAEWTVAYANREVARLNDTTPDALVGRNHWTIWPETVGNEVEDRYRYAAANRVSVQFEHYYPRAGVWHEISAHPADGGGLSIVFRDVTVRRRSDAAARLLAEVGALLASSLDEGDRHRGLARALVPALADWCVIDVVDDGPDGRPLSARRAAWAHADPVREPLLASMAERFPPDLNQPTLSRSLSGTGAGHLMPDVDEAMLGAIVRSPEQARVVTALGLRSAMIVPLQARGRLMGVIALFSSVRRFDATDLALAEEVARRDTLAVDNARAYAAAVSARAAAEASRARLAFLSDAAATLSASLDYETTLQTVAGLAVPAVADWCMVDVLESEHVIRRVAVAHADPAKADVARRFRRALAHRPDDEHGVSPVVATGRTRVEREVTEAVLRGLARDDEHLELLRGLEMRSYVTVPLIARGHSLGAVTFVASGGRVPFDGEDVTAFEALALRAAVAVDNARLFTETERARDRAARLQEATAALAGAVTVAAVAAVIVEQAVATLAAAAGALALLDDDGSHLRTSGSRGYAAEEVDSWQRFPLALDTPVTDAVRDGRPVYLSSPEEWEARYPSFSGRAAQQFNAWAVVPMRVDDHAIGALALSFAEPRPFTAEDRAFAESLASQCALAVERARAFASERDARAEAEDARRRAEQANRAKSDFLAVMSHELRTPLNAIGGYAELIEMGIRGPVTAQQCEDLARIRKSQKHLLGLINEVLNYARVDSGVVRYAIADVSLAEVIASVEPLVTPQLGAKSLAYDAEPGDEDVTVRADRDKLRQVLINLLSNAIKFTARDGRITVRWSADGDRARVTVHDTGLGIPADKLEAIFEPFVQVNAGLTRTQDGTGLGLAISRDLARGMGGDLTVESEPDAGSTFTLLLPLAPR